LESAVALTLGVMGLIAIISISMVALGYFFKEAVLKLFEVIEGMSKGIQ
tara:strand:+ start:1124 stop:1270 length:147 start_codon:yes stop_codon:yes gene_type:complete